MSFVPTDPIDPTASLAKPSPFVVFTEHAIPATFDESLSYQQALYALNDFIQKQVVPVINENAHITEQQTETIHELQDYVDHYFDNLDIQEEINNKLDDMAESGELADIIAQYLNSNAILAYNTVGDLEDAENVVNGSFARTYGKDEYNDGKGAFYKIRTIINTDVVDGDNIVALPDDTLVAEKMPDYNINTINTNITNINGRIDDLANKNYRKMILIGDSYCEESTDHDITKFYWETLRDNLSLTQNVNFFASYASGAGFGNQMFLTKLQDLAATITDKDSITDIIVCGGWNDSDVSQSYGTDEAFNAGILAFNTYVKANYPNARVTIAHISWGDPLVSNDYDTIYWQMPTSIKRYKQACDLYGWNYLNGTEYILHIYDATYWESDGNHPSQKGQTLLGNNLTRAFVSGSIETYRVNSATIIGSGDMEYTNFSTIYSELNNENCRLWCAKTNVGIYFKVNETVNPTMNCDGAHEYELATFSSKEIIGHDLFVLQGIPLYITGSHDGGATSTYMGFGDLIVKNSKLCLRPTLFDGGQRQENINVNYIWIPNFSIMAPSVVC